MKISTCWSQLAQIVVSGALLLQLSACSKTNVPACPTGEVHCNSGSECESAICGASACCVPKSTAQAMCSTDDDCPSGESCSDGGCSSPSNNSGCATDDDCAGTPATPHCNSSGACVGCRSTADCPGANQVCDTTSSSCAFAPGYCAANSDCSGTPATPVCDTVLGQCVGCIMDSDCAPATCNIETETCNAVMDAGVTTMDAGNETDAGEDAGHRDGGRMRDAGHEMDAGEDAGTQPDAGETPDAGTDAGVVPHDAGSPGTDAGTSGADAGPCARTTDCPAGQVCESSTCGPAKPCTSNAQCTGANTHCNPINSLCAECAVSSDCATGEVCYGGICVTATPCTDDMSCAQGDVCLPLAAPDFSAWENQCIPENAGGALGGAPCSSDAACKSGFCLLIYSPTGTDGFCLDNCTSTADCATGAQCPPNGLEFQLLPQADGGYDSTAANEIGADDQVCAPEACTSDTQCKTAGAGGVARACSLLPGKVSTTNAQTQTFESVVEACMPAQGTIKGGIACSTNNPTACKSGICFNWSGLTECFGACTKNSDCPVLDTCTATGFVDEAGNAIKSCF